MCKQEENAGIFGGGKINWCHFSITENERKGGK